MKMDRIFIDFGFDMIIDVLILRVEQLVKFE